MKVNNEIRRTVGKLSQGSIIYLVILSVVSGLFVIVGVAGLQGDYGSTSQAVSDAISNEWPGVGFGYIAGAVIAAGVLYFFYWNLPRENIFRRNGHMTLLKLLVLFCVVAGLQLITAPINVGIEYLFRAFGYSMIGEWSVGTAQYTNLPMLLYAAVAGPIAEEVTFRGFALKSLKRFGKGFAIIMTSLMFSVFHANFYQMPFTFVMGIVLAYVAMEYSIYWSIALHMMNNGFFIFLSYVTMGMHGNWGTMVQILVLLACFVLAIIYCVLHANTISTYIRQNRSHGCYSRAFRSPSLIVLIVLCVTVAVLGLQPV